MFATEPPDSDYDLHFRVAGVRVRVHPYFWLMTLLLIIFQKPSVQEVLIWFVAVFVSILVHEFGHVLAFAYYGQPSHVVLYQFGGLAVPDARWSGYNPYQDDTRSQWSQMTIAFAGPLAGFLFAALVVAAVYLSGYHVRFASQLEFLNFSLGDPKRTIPSDNLDQLVWDLVQVNILWGIMNLLPVYPLDGGQIARAILTMANPSEGLKQSLMLSVFAAGGVAVLAIAKWHELYMAVLFGYLAYSSYTMLQQFTGGGYGGGRGW